MQDARAKVMVVMGTRPEGVKLAPVVHALQADELLNPVVVATAQHRQMLDQVLTHFGVRPDHDLDLLAPGDDLTTVAAKALVGLGGVVEVERPDLLVVQGDTTSTLAGALAGFYHQVPVVHVEAGLRTDALTEPFPEEGNRRLVTRISSLHLAPTTKAAAALLAEGVPGSQVVTTGNTVVDALLYTVATGPSLPLWSKLAEHRGPVLLVTAHRRESWGTPLRELASGLLELARRRPELLIVLPVHGNPRVRADLAALAAGPRNVELLDALDYPTFVACMQRATILLTDSGGVQEEAPSLRKPVLVTRAVTERMEGLERGCARLIGTQPSAVVPEVEGLLDDADAYEQMSWAGNPYGDGDAATRCVAAMHGFLGTSTSIGALQLDPGSSDPLFRAA